MNTNFKYKILKAINKHINENNMALKIIDDDDDSILVKSDKSHFQQHTEEHKTIGYMQLTDIQQVIEKELHISKINDFKIVKSAFNNLPIYKSKNLIGQTSLIQLEDLLKFNGWHMVNNIQNIINSANTANNVFENFIYSNAYNEYYNFKKALYAYLANDFGMVAIYYSDYTFAFLLTGNVIYDDCFEPKEDLTKTQNYAKFVAALEANYMKNPYDFGMMLKKDDNNKLYMETYWLRNLSNTKRKNYIAKNICKRWAESDYVKISPDKNLYDFITKDNKLGAKIFIEKDINGNEIQGLRIYLIT